MKYMAPGCRHLAAEAVWVEVPAEGAEPLGGVGAWLGQDGALAGAAHCSVLARVAAGTVERAPRARQVEGEASQRGRALAAGEAGGMVGGFGDLHQVSLHRAGAGRAGGQAGSPVLLAHHAPVLPGVVHPCQSQPALAANFSCGRLQIQQ